MDMLTSAETRAASAATLSRPKSAVSHGVGLIGLAGLLLWIAGARWVQALHPELGVGEKWYALGAVAAAGLPMTLWSIVVDKVHRNPTTGIDWAAPPKPFAETREISLTKLAGLWATWGLLLGVYWVGRWYHTGAYAFTIDVMEARVAFVPVIGWLFILSVPYVMWIDRRFIEPRDGAYALGAWLMGEKAADWDAINAHLRAWAVKGFFLAFMISIVPGGYHQVVSEPWGVVTGTLVNLTGWLISFMFVIDVCLATTGYLLTAKPLDAHIRSATPYAAGWIAALICYPPFVLIGSGGPLDYHQNTAEWDFWLARFNTPFVTLPLPHYLVPITPSMILMSLWAVLLVVLTAIYAWATMAFGIRFSNLTDRGILTHGPYAWTKHPAYLSKNTFWWLSTLPFLATSNWHDAVRNTVLMACVSGVYYWRARTEEWHLRANPDYLPYEKWMAEHGLITARLKRVLGF
jgi:protein-S-isoprenylcysteine O-methyltransferase Ste14